MVLGTSEFCEASHQFLHTLVGKRDCDLFIVVARDTRDHHPFAERRMGHAIARAKLRFRRTCAPLFRRTAAPRGGQPREHRIAPRLLALLVARAVALPVEFGPRVALLRFAAAAKLDAPGTPLR